MRSGSLCVKRGSWSHKAGPLGRMRASRFAALLAPNSTVALQSPFYSILLFCGMHPCVCSLSQMAGLHVRPPPLPASVVPVGT
jgi:hypothetical protein